MAQLNIFLRFPETPDEIIDLGEDIEQYRNISRSIQTVKEQLSNIDYCLLYDSENIQAFKRQAQILSEGYLLNKVINQIRSLISPKKSQDIHTTRLYRADHQYHIWNIHTCQIDSASDIIKSSAEKIHNNEICTVFLLTKQNSFNRNVIPVVIDASHAPHPELSIVPVSETVQDCVDWIRQIKQNCGFSLHNAWQFLPTNMVYPASKQKIYKNLNDGSYWYYDYFHRENQEHYEVFDTHGNHIGEADMTGKIDRQKCDKTKKISHLLN
ncbi:hypothetical protein [Bacteroides acidifaciens]|uniref:hypothetical protein n=2 Tax=Bacteroidales TaxID=171549 RepID=UPI002557CF74|nr:hypothetical protein [Bacteroides acidifaciens]